MASCANRPSVFAPGAVLRSRSADPYVRSRARLVYPEALTIRWVAFLLRLVRANAREESLHVGQGCLRRPPSLQSSVSFTMEWMRASGRGARLATSYRRRGTSDRDEFRVISGGVPGTEMAGSFPE